MEWEELVAEIEKRFDYLTRIKASREGLSPTKLPPMLIFSAGLIISAIFNENHNRIVLLLHNRFNIDKWIAVLAVLEILRRDYQSRKAFLPVFKRGQKLLFNNSCIVEFDEFESDRIWIKAADNKQATNSRFSLRMNRIMQLQPVEQSRKLSSVRRVRVEYSKSPKVPVDEILNNSTMGNRTIFESNIVFVGRIGKSIEFINNTEINNARLIDLFLWGKLNTEGNISIINKRGVQASPSCIISPDLYSAVNYCSMEESKSKAIVLGNAAFARNDLQSFYTLLDSKIPMVVIAEFSETDELDLFLENHFKIWQWNEINLVKILNQNQIQENTIFAPFLHTIKNLCYQKTEIIICHYPELESISNKLINFEKKIPHENDEIKNLFSKLFKLHIEFLRLIRMPSEKWLDRYREKIKGLQEQFKRQRLWLSIEDIDQINQIISSLSKISETPFTGINHKLDKLQELIKQKSKSEKIIIIVPRNEDIEATKSFWEELYSEDEEKLNNVLFLTPVDIYPELTNDVSSKLIVPGWLGHKTMYSIFHCYITETIIFLGYPKEVTWYKLAVKKWKQKRKFETNLNDFVEILELSPNSLDLLDPTPEAEPEEPNSHSEENILEIELKLKQYRFSRYKAPINTVDFIEKAKPIVFNDGRFAFFTKTHRCLVVNDLIQNKSSKKIEIQKYQFKNVSVGDYILFFDANRDLIREVADIILKKNGLTDLRDKAKFWQKILLKKTEKLNFDTVVKILRQKGCKRHPLTIKNWLEDEDIIGPADPEDLKIILKAFPMYKAGNEIDELFNEIQNAVIAVRGAHQKASSLLSRLILENLPDIIGENENIYKPVIIELRDFGRVMILRVEEIGNEWMDVEKRNTNRLLSGEI